MASTRERFTKDGRRYFEIIVSRGRGKSYLTQSWYPSDTWSEKTIQKRLSDAAAEFERQVKSGEYISREERKELERIAAAEAAKIKTFKEYVDQVYLPALRVTASRHTLDSFERNLKLHIEPRIGGLKLPDITSAEITALLLAAQSSGLKIASVIKIYGVLNLIFKKAYLEDNIPRNPMDKVSRPKARKDEAKVDKVEAYTVKELVRIMVLVDEEPLPWRTYMRLLIDTGCRRGEACGLRWKDINFKENSITFCHTLAYTPKDGIYLDTPKNGKSRKVFVDPEVIALLKQLRSDKTIVNLKSDGYVFTQSHDSELPMHPDTPTRYFKKFGDRHGLDSFHPHKLRHSFASIAITNGADPVSVSQKLGHSDVAVTLRIYSHASEESQKAASDVFRNALKPKEA